MTLGENMFIRRIQSPKDEPRIGDTTKRVVVFLFGALFAALSVVALVAKAYGVAALLGVPALILFAIALWGGRKPVSAAHDASSVVQDISNLP